MIKEIDYGRCTGCGICVDVCPLDTLRLDPFQEEMPPCQEACPAGVDTRGYISFLKLGIFDEAEGLLRQYLPFPAITGRICHHPCESECARRNVDEALNINSIERYVGDYLLHERADRLPVLHAGKVAVIGSGPAGLSAAYFLIRMGYRVTVFESGTEVGGMLRTDIREDRLPRDVLEAQLNNIKDMGIEFRTNTTLGRDLTLDDLREHRYKAVFLSTGFRSEDTASLPDEIMRDEERTVIVDPVTLETGVTGVFAGGGLLMDRSPVVKVIASAKRAAISIDRYIQGKDLKEGREQEIKRVENLPKEGIRQMPRQEAPERSTDESEEGIAEIRAGFTEEMATREVLRCMSCGSKAYIAHPEDCMTCFECEVECPSDAIDVNPYKEQMPLTLPISRGG